MVSEVVSEGCAPDLVKRALFGGHGGVAVQPKPAPVPVGREGGEADQGTRQRHLGGARLEPPLLLELRGQGALRRAAARDGGIYRYTASGEGFQGSSAEAAAITACASPTQ